MRKLVYIAGPYAGDIEENVKRATKLAKLAITYGLAPVVPHILGASGLYGDPLEASDDGTRERALDCSVSLASVVGASGGHMWVILHRDGTRSPGTLREVYAWNRVRTQAFRIERTWEAWLSECDQP